MASNGNGLVASAIVELSKAFVNNYLRAIKEARDKSPNGSDITDEQIADALASASEQNADLISFFGSELGVQDSPEWSEAIKGWSESLATQAQRLRDAEIPALERIGGFLAVANGGLATGLEAVNGNPNVLGALHGIGNISNALALASAVRDGDYGAMAAVGVGVFVGGAAADLASALLLAVDAPLLVVFLAAAGLSC